MIWKENRTTIYNFIQYVAGKKTSNLDCAEDQIEDAFDCALVFLDTLVRNARLCQARNP